MHMSLTLPTWLWINTFLVCVRSTWYCLFLQFYHYLLWDILCLYFFVWSDEWRRCYLVCICQTSPLLTHDVYPPNILAGDDHVSRFIRRFMLLRVFLINYVKRHGGPGPWNVNSYLRSLILLFLYERLQRMAFWHSWHLLHCWEKCHLPKTLCNPYCWYILDSPVFFWHRQAHPLRFKNSSGNSLRFNQLHQQPEWIFRDGCPWIIATRWYRSDKPSVKRTDRDSGFGISGCGASE